MILSHELWQRRYGGDPTVIARSIALNEVPHRVLGVMPKGFKHPDPTHRGPTAAWMPLVLRHDRYPFVATLGRRKAGVALAGVRAEFHALASTPLRTPTGTWR